MKIFIVDAFSNKAFGGNPAGVVMLDREEDDEFLKNIAQELRMSSTAFVEARSQKTFKLEKNFNLKSFTPEVELSLCGHAILASAKVLFDYFENMNEILSFRTKSGEIICSKKNDKIEMQMPINEPKLMEDYISFENMSNLHDNEILYSAYDFKTKKMLVEINSMEKLENILFDFNKLIGMIFPYPVRGLIVTTKGDEKYDFYSRYFAPWEGVIEDYVSGSSHTVLYPYWRDKLGKEDMLAKQISKRSGELYLSQKKDKLLILADAKITLSGKFEG
jgi:PhzF family phenazine biosynthesis protein